ncbi:MAG: hypothetical protein L3J08_06055 [Flavobacteriaceae bacterium]|nr:hypothetical protein [Flavobacteriaceae bacterium]
MRKALSNLKKSNISAKGTEIKTTHLYVKFKPKTEEELSILKRDSTLVLYTYPLDYEIEENGDFYRDPQVPNGQPTYQYCAVKVNKELPSGVETEILEKLFIPDEDKDDNTDKKSISYEMIDALVDEALRITGNIEEEEKKSNLALKILRSRWRPSGKITMNDDTLGNIGVEGLKIRARRWFTTHTGFTNIRGDFSCNGRFKRKARYRLDWERYQFALRSGGFSSAEKKGPRGKGKSWNWHITSGEHKYYATIFRAAYHYYYKDIKRLRRPKQNSFLRSQLRIGAFTQDNGSSLGIHQSGAHFAGLVTGIKIYTYSKESVQTYSTTIHELAHSAHYEMNKLNFFSVNAKVKESWVRGVEWELTRMTYPNYLGRERSTGDYTLVVADLIDDDFVTTASETNFGYYKKYEDQVSGFTISQLEYSLKTTQSWNGWRDRLISIRGSDYNNNITRLFAAYE